MGSYDSANISELVGDWLLYKLNDIIDPGCHGIYRDDGLIIFGNCTPRKGDIIRKKLHALFTKFGFKLDIQANLKITNYLDVTFNLYDGTVSPYRKKTHQYPCYINVGSNHPKKVFKQTPKSIMIRLSTNSSNEDINRIMKIEDIKKNSYIKVEKTIQTYRIGVIIGKEKS